MDLSEADKKQLATFYNEFLVQYTVIIENGLIPRYSPSNERLPIELSGIKASIKNILTNSESRSWKEAFGIIKMGQEGVKTVKEHKKLSILLANIFALWTLMNSEHYEKA